ncbi:hypothetical protein ID866_5824 [Astraeus odoratus]|nr:hypothetical protein ID866_5824 [Astraeus odoratus]
MPFTAQRLLLGVLRGSALGANWTLPGVDLSAVRFQQHDSHALLLICGFGAFNSLLMFENRRKALPGDPHPDGAPARVHF